MSELRIRDVKTSDHQAIDEVLVAAFKGSNEVKIVHAIRQAEQVRVELVCVEGDQIVGQILFSALQVSTAEMTLNAVALAPLSVAPNNQRKGVGAKLIKEGHKRLIENDVDLSVVLGHPAYYTRFGYSPDIALKLQAPYSGRSFMAMEFKQGVLGSRRWEVRYPQAFSS